MKIQGATGFVARSFFGHRGWEKKQEESTFTFYNGARPLNGSFAEYTPSALLVTP